MRGIFLVIILIFSIGFFSCKKENSSTFVIDSTLQVNDTTWTNTQSIKSLANAVATDFGNPILIDTISLNNQGFDESKQIFNSNKYRIDISPEGLINPNNYKHITKGIITIKLQSSTSKGEIIKNFNTSFLNNQPNISFGYYSLSIYYKDTLLIIDNDHPVHLYVQDSSATINTLKNCIVYKGSSSNLTDDNFKWNIDTFSTLSLSCVTQQGPPTKPWGFEFPVFSSKWLTLASPENVPPSLNKFSTYLPANYTNKNTVIYAVQKNNRDVARLLPDYNSRTFSLNSLPYSQGVNLISISKIDNQYYLGTSIVNYNPQQTIFKLIPQKISLQNLISYLNTL